MASSERKITSDITEKLADGKPSTVFFDTLTKETKILVIGSMYVWYAWFRFFSGCRIPVPKIVNYLSAKD